MFRPFTPADWDLDQFNRRPPASEDPVVKEEKIPAGSKCHHWRRAPNGTMGYARPVECEICFGTGTVLRDVVLRFRAKTGMMARFPNGMADPARYRDDVPASLRGIRGRRVA